MVVDTTKRKGPGDWQDAVEACHKIHNVPHFNNVKEEIKWIWEEPFANAFPENEYAHLPGDFERRNFPVLCNHCENPPCVRVCPTKATFKRPQDGIVMMDYHRCIGCRFCMAACPYGSRSFNWSDPRLALDMDAINREFPTRGKGVVEKCNFCAERLAKGLQPACVEACKDGALVFGDLNDPASEVRRILDKRFAIRRKPSLGTGPSVYYVV
jgi:molybdopterin-containing oxidoreductase family iron-sulfur binding subunit